MEAVLAKIIKWAFENGIEISVRNYKEIGMKDQIEIDLKKNGVSELIRIFDWDELDRRWLQNAIQDRALNLSLTKLAL
jgi:hypothetical protein